MSEFRAYIKEDEINCEGPDDKVEMFSQFLDEIQEAVDISICDCQSNDKVREVVANYFPDYVDDIMDIFENSGGYCDCEIGVSAMTQNSIIKKLGRYMDIQEL